MLLSLDTRRHSAVATTRSRFYTSMRLTGLSRLSPCEGERIKVRVFRLVALPPA